MPLEHPVSKVLWAQLVWMVAVDFSVPLVSQEHLELRAQPGRPDLLVSRAPQVHEGAQVQLEPQAPKEVLGLLEILDPMDSRDLQDHKGQ